MFINVPLSHSLICSPSLLAGQKPSKLNYPLKLNFSLNKEMFFWLILSSYLALRAIVQNLRKPTQGRQIYAEGKKNYLIWGVYNLENSTVSLEWWGICFTGPVISLLLKSFAKTYHTQLLHCPCHPTFRRDGEKKGNSKTKISKIIGNSQTSRASSIAIGFNDDEITASGSWNYPGSGAE